jgi:CTP-dependent riboflavin kinase
MNHHFIGESKIDCSDTESLAYSYGNIHGFKGKSSERDSEMKFTAKWKTGGHRYNGTLSIQVKPSDKDERKPSAHQENKGIDVAKENVENFSKGDASLDDESLMVVGQFDSGVNRGVRSWSFKGYRKQGR